MYSWVPTAVQDKLLSICRHNLAPQGVAYVSYNTYPGWHMRGMIRDMMGYHARQFADITTKLGQARALLDFLAKHVPTESGAVRSSAQAGSRDAAQGSRTPTSCHEHLEEHNEPVYFHEFADRCGRHGVAIPGRGRVPHHGRVELSAGSHGDAEDAIAPNIVQMEQYMDFLRNRMFRQSLLVHHEIALNRNLDGRSVEGFLAGTPMRCTSAKVDYLSGTPERFEMRSGAGIVTPEPVVKAALTILAEIWPQTMPVPELRKQARARLAALGAPGTEADLVRDAELIGSDILRCFAAGIAELRSEPVPMALQLSGRPRAHPLVRYQASTRQRGGQHAT